MTHYFYFFTKYIALLSLIVKKWCLHIYHIIWRIYHCHFVRFCMTFLIYIHVRNDPRPQAVLFYRLIPSVFHKTLSKYTPKNSFKLPFFYMSRPNTFTFWMKNISLSFCSILYDIFNLYTCKKRNGKWVLRLCKCS
jgi:hypothetical protein